jgi:Holliday junction resolvasome RuvABC endonuclease subunit
MIILGIDPGIATVGFALLEKEGNILRVLEY